jgi:16S rRNA (cytidine1402-2'-O)-methyltransferase
MAEIRSDQQKLSPGLYVVATPIGNLGDMTRRAKETLMAADLVACEDTRVTAKLMNAFLIKKPLLPYHEHNGAAQRPKILAKIREGGVVALVSDAGTPLISDPGYKLVEEAHKDGLKVVAIPGPSALITALSLAGLPTNRFVFLGFPPNKQKARRDWFAAEQATGATLVFYENNKRLPACLKDAAISLGDRNAAVCRELTKKFEEVVKDDLTGLAEHYAQIGPPKGEIVVVIEGPQKHLAQQAPDQAELDRALTLALEHMSVKSAAAFVSELLDIKRKQVYSRALEISKG